MKVSPISLFYTLTLARAVHQKRDTVWNKRVLRIQVIWYQMSFQIREITTHSLGESSSTSASPNNKNNTSSMQTEEEDETMTSPTTRTNQQVEISESDGSSSGGDFCPLFMDGLPSDFSSNSQLAAIASFLVDDDQNDERQQEEEEEKDDDDSDATPIQCNRASKPVVSRGGKMRNHKRNRAARRDSPYTTPSKKQNQSKSKHNDGMGEAQLFLKMWKLS